MSHSIDNELRRLEQELRGPLAESVQPPPTPEETAELIRALQGEFDHLRKGDGFVPLGFNPQVDPPSLRRLLRSQFRLNHKALFFSAAAVFIMLILFMNEMNVFSFTGQFSLSPDIMFPLITPLLLIASLLFGSRTWDAGMRAVEGVTPYPPALVLYSRMLIVMAVVIGWAGISSAVIGVNYAADHTLSMSEFLLFLAEWLGITLFTGGVVMFILFHKGMKLAAACSTLLFVGWLCYQNYMPGRITLEARGGVDLSLLILGSALILVSYIKILHLQAFVQGENHDSY
ncbi:hypothetical protein DCC85_18755 [Paenibacillus sp. CAA11]|uniref:hypothetical protein n=1 Tax=Paenibacillus sp. CAA11 TaxID=1532905 RepID=UPI000D334C93|nr:hypothetical protein [Paenibacillus sp. CAA11]AWB46008.1 hypothetical protein DCC85_18755 [Paenibacillus sp. CAA11]